MNKKIIIITVSLAAVLAAAIIAALSISGKMNLDFSSKDGKEETSSVTSENKNDGNKEGKSDEKDTDAQSSGKINTKKGKTVSAKATDELITVPVSVTGNPGMIAGQLYIEYDQTAFDFADCTAGDIFTDCQSNAKDGVVSCVIMDDIASDTKDSTKTGVLVNIVLKPKAGIKSGTYSLKIKDETLFANIDEKYVYPTVSVGDIVIK